MGTIRNLLQDADPLRHEPEWSDEERARLRQTVIVTASDGTTDDRRRSLPRRSMILAVALIVGSVVGWRIWSHGGTTLHAAVQFEVRLAETFPARGLEEIGVEPDHGVIYLHPEIVLDNGDIAGSRVIPGNNPSQFNVAITFTPAGGEKMRIATANHIGKPIAILVDGEVVMAPTVRSPIGDSAVITGAFSYVEAERIANGMLLR